MLAGICPFSLVVGRLKRYCYFEFGVSWGAFIGRVEVLLMNVGVSPSIFGGGSSLQHSFVVTFRPVGRFSWFLFRLEASFSCNPKGGEMGLNSRIVDVLASIERWRLHLLEISSVGYFTLLLLLLHCMDPLDYYGDVKVNYNCKRSLLALGWS